MKELNMTSLKSGFLVVIATVALAGCDNSKSTKQDVADESTAEAYESAEQICNTCGTVASITPVSVKGDGTGAGAVIGAVVGGLLGHQVGGGSGKDVATGVGAVGGAIAGNEIEKQSKKEIYYEVIVNMDQGGTQTARVYSADRISVGTPVKVVGNNLELQ